MRATSNLALLIVAAAMQAAIATGSECVINAEFNRRANAVIETEIVDVAPGQPRVGDRPVAARRRLSRH
jgi:hypothetical protein